MAPDFTRTGAFHIDGRFATAIHYRTVPGLPADTTVSLRFLNGRHQVAQYQLPVDQARELLGPENYKALEKATRQPRADDVVGPPAPVQGRLQGPRLHYREAVGAGPDALVAPPNAIHEGTLLRPTRPETWQTPGQAPVGVRGEAGSSAPHIVEPSAPPREQRIPASVTARFLRMDNRFYFPDKTLAFIDDGRRLQAPTAHQEVVRSLVEIAQARGWSTLTVTGQGEFRAAVWREATRRGLSVQGYAPSDLERQSLAREGARVEGARKESLVHESGTSGTTRSLGSGSSQDVVDAVVTLWLGEQFARSRWADQPHQQARFVAQVRERLAQKVERGEPLHGPTMRREVERLLQRAEGRDRAPGRSRGSREDPVRVH